jgi:hypothetical protein
MGILIIMLAAASLRPGIIGFISGILSGRSIQDRVLSVYSLSQALWVDMVINDLPSAKQHLWIQT